MPLSEKYRTEKWDENETYLYLLSRYFSSHFVFSRSRSRSVYSKIHCRMLIKLSMSCRQIVEIHFNKIPNICDFILKQYTKMKIFLSKNHETLENNRYTIVLFVKFISGNFWGKSKHCRVWYEIKYWDML